MGKPTFTFKAFQAEYPSDAACLDRIMTVQYGGTEFDCPGCGVASRFSRISKRRAFACQHCGHHVYPCVGTPFEKSRTPLTTWFFAMYLMTTTRNGVAAKELQRQIGCTYKCAWRIAHQLRKLMASADYQGPLGGTVEVDETLIGGKVTGAHRGPKANKTIVMGIVERGGRVRAAPIPNDRAEGMRRAIKTNVEEGSNVFTDEHRSYQGLNVRGYHHFTVNHSAKEYVRDGIIHTNTVEGFWAHLKKGIASTHVGVSRQHLWKYVSEFAYRYNNRHAPEAMFNRLVVSFAQPRSPAR